MNGMMNREVTGAGSPVTFLCYNFFPFQVAEGKKMGYTITRGIVPGGTVKTKMRMHHELSVAAERRKNEENRYVDQRW